MKNNQTRKIALLAVITALSIVLGNFFKIPTPTGFLTLLDAGIYFTAFYFGRKEGALVGGLSGLLIDLVAGYPQWMVFKATLLASLASSVISAYSWLDLPWSVAMLSLVAF